MSADAESGGDAEPQDGSAGESAHADADPGVRRRGKRILEADPGLSPAGFAGRLFAELNTPPDVATDLYHDLAEPDQSDAVGDGGDSVVVESAADLYEEAAANGWAHSYDRNPFKNLRALFEATTAADADREAYTAVAFKRIAGLGPTYIGNSYEQLAETTDLEIPGEGGDADATRPTDQPEPGESDQSAAEPAPPAPPEPAPASGEPAPSTDQSDASDDGPASADAIREHYQRLEDRAVYGALGAIDADAVDGDADLSALGNQDFAGWYRSRDAGGSWDGRGRPWVLAKEFDDIREGAPTDPHDDGLERTLYATINYTAIPWFMDSWDRYEWVEKDGKDKPDRVWEAQSSPTPGYDALHAYAPFADVDLADDVKADRPAGDVPTDRLEEALRRYVAAFADLAGGREHVYALDSVGGAYLFVAPSSTTPIATAFDGDDRAAIFDELTDRLNDWLGDVAKRVTDATDLADVFEPDLLNNKNRLYKAPLSVHTSLDGVVTPVAVDDPTYQFTPLEETSGELIDETRAWVDGFTADHRDAVDAIVATLWPEHYGDAGGWRDALAAWLEDHHEEEARNQERERERIPSDEIPDDLETTDDLEIIKSKIDGIDVADLIDDKIGAAVEGESTDHTNNDGIRFDPPWRGSESGQSCFADSVKFYDPDAEYSGGAALEFIAVERGIVSRPGDKLTGNKYWRAVNALREEGYHIPYFEGSDGRHADVLRLFTEPETDDDRKRQLARALFADR